MKANVMKFWYTVKDSEGTYLIGYCLGRIDADEVELIETMNQYCSEKDYELVLLIQAVPFLSLVNQVFPEKITEESQYCLGKLLQVVYGQ